MASVNVLIVEDVAVNAHPICVTLREMNITYTIATQVAGAAAELAKSNHFDVILMDLYLPNLDSLTIADELRSNAAYKRRPIPIIALTTHELSENKIAFLKKIGIDDCLTKPPSKEKLLRIITQHVVMKKKL